MLFNSIKNIHIAEKMKISIITINRNNDSGLQKTLNSVISQSASDFEHIIIDGASTDNSVETIKKYAADSVIGNRVHWVSEPDNGVYCAMNKGVVRARGEYLLFLNSGDYLFDSDVIDKIITRLDSDIIYGSLLLSDNETSKVVSYADKLNFTYFLSGTIPHPATFIRRELFDNQLYSECYKISSDWEFFMLAICRYNASYKRVDDVITVFDNYGISSDPANAELIEAEHKDSIGRNFRHFLTAYEEMKMLVEYKTRIDKFKGNRWLKLGYKLGLFKQYKYL